MHKFYEKGGHSSFPIWSITSENDLGRVFKLKKQQKNKTNLHPHNI